jgi:hypothetical protein
MKRPIILVVTVILVGCASNPRVDNVIPLEGGVYEAFATGRSKEAALRPVLYSADFTCRERLMHFVVLEEETEYKGLVSESTNQVINKAEEIIVATTGESFPTLSGEDDYYVSMRFRCE